MQRISVMPEDDKIMTETCSTHCYIVIKNCPTKMYNLMSGLRMFLFWQ
jgi:hypothetical protein